MSVVFLLAPTVVASWPVLCGAIAGAAGVLGYKALNTGQLLKQEEAENAWVEVSIEGSEIIADAMKRESEFTIGRDDVIATFRRSADGRCSVHVTGHNKSESELEQIGRELVGRVTQQYAYHRVLSELKSQGFTVTGEEVTADQRIRINVCKFV